MKTKLTPGLGLLRVGLVGFSTLIGSAGGAWAQTLKVLHAFSGKFGDGALPVSGVTLDEAGNIYGVTPAGGGGCPIPFGPIFGCGVVYKIDTSGRFTILVRFDGKDNVSPQATLAIRKDVLYGTTANGGSVEHLGGVFSIRTNGTNFRKLHDFTGPDGCGLIGKIAVDGLGNVFGTAVGCGLDYSAAHQTGKGTLWEVKPDKNFILLHAFTGGSDGLAPTDVLLSNGTLFGATRGDYGIGVPSSIYRLPLATGALTPLHQFDIATEGAGPVLGGINPNGNIFGQSFGHDASLSPVGFLFELLEKNGAYNFHSLYGYEARSMPSGVNVAGHNSVLSTTFYGGPSNGGSLFSTQNGVTSLLYTVPRYMISQGRNLIGAPVQTADGSIIAVTHAGGVHCRQQPGGCGVVFRLSPAPP